MELRPKNKNRIIFVCPIPTLLGNYVLRSVCLAGIDLNYRQETASVVHLKRVLSAGAGVDDEVMPCPILPLNLVLQCGRCECNDRPALREWTILGLDAPIVQSGDQSRDSIRVMLGTTI